jgi:low temperature requirement protein LtrA
VRHPFLVVLALATAALAAFGVWFAIGHEPVGDLSRRGHVAFASLLLVPPILFLLLATGLEARRHQRSDVLGMLALATLVGTPAVLHFLGSLGVVVVLVVLVLLALAARQRRGHDSRPRSADLRR